MNEQPVKLEIGEHNALLIEWSDGSRRRYDASMLRRRCPCATCNTERNRLGTDRSDELRGVPDDVAVRQMNPVGNYAYNIVFSDGHATGIYPLEALYAWGEEAPST